MLSLHLLSYGIFAPIVGTLTDRWKPKRIMLAGVIIVGTSAALCSLGSTLWHFYLLFGVLTPIGLACCGSPVMNPTIANWFTDRRGLALGLAQMGGGLSFVYVIAVEYTIELFNWRFAYVLMGAAVVCVLIPLIAAFYYFHPSQKGVSAFRTKSNQERSPNRPRHRQRERPEWNLRQALTSYRLWLLVISNMCFWGSGCYLVLAHQIKFALDMGYTGILATSVFAMFGIAMVVGQVSSAVSDIVGRELTVLVSTILVVLAVSLLSSVSDKESAWKLYVYAITFGFGAGLYSPTIFVGAADIFHGRHFGMLNGIILAGLGFGGAFGPSLGGYLHDFFGNYRYAFFFAIASFIVAGISFIAASPRHYRQRH
jgi:MFS family permease